MIVNLNKIICSFLTDNTFKTSLSSLFILILVKIFNGCKIIIISVLKHVI